MSPMKKVIVLQILLLSAMCAICQSNSSQQRVPANQVVETRRPDANKTCNSGLVERKHCRRVPTPREGKVYYARAPRSIQALQRIRRPIPIGN